MKKNVSFEKINRFFNRIKLPKQLIVLLIGFLSTIWFLVRVIPKPSRASYPCMQAAAPWMSGFILYIAGITSATFAFKRFKSQINKSKYYIAGIFFFIGIVAGIIAISSNQTKTKGAGTYLGETIVENPNEPIGEAKGIFPGRVSWAYNPDATNEDCDPSDYGHTYYTDENTNQDVVDEMLDDILLSITGEKTIQEAWDAIF
ncbi:MAG: hypothetical protein JXB17_07810, partial [Bacteroidales bacterium]|nr:hypothetical protein [Bacteroidales bacterium]